MPRFSSVHWAVCVPKSCTPKDVEKSIVNVAESLSAGTGLKANVKVVPEMCQIASDGRLPNSTLFVGYL